jgi:carbamoyltransferase
LAEKASTYFALDVESPYMLLVAQVCKERQLPMHWESFTHGDDDMLPVINQPRSDIPAVTHVDYSTRVQTVHPQEKPDFYQVIKAFEALTGCAVIVNTSFNVRGEPIVCSPQDAYRCFMRTEMDLLVMEDCLLHKDQQPVFEDEEDWRSEYELD